MPFLPATVVQCAFTSATPFIEEDSASCLKKFIVIFTFLIIQLEQFEVTLCGNTGPLDIQFEPWHRIFMPVRLFSDG